MQIGLRLSQLMIVRGEKSAKTLLRIRAPPPFAFAPFESERRPFASDRRSFASDRYTFASKRCSFASDRQSFACHHRALASDFVAP